MLCLSGHTGQGEVTTAVSVQTVPASTNWQAVLKATRVLIDADDTRGTLEALHPAMPVPCGSLSDYRPRVLAIDTLRRSAKVGFFAESEAEYVTPKQAYDACATRAEAKLKGEEITIRYALKSGEVKVDSPVAFDSTLF
jgi:hypothetical protein